MNPLKMKICRIYSVVWEDVVKMKLHGHLHDSQRPSKESFQKQTPQSGLKDETVNKNCGIAKQKTK
jgi:hypothetical protein